MNQTGLHRDLTSFLYTAPEQRDVLPTMSISQNSADLSRLYHELLYDNFVRGMLNTGHGKVHILIKMDDLPADERQRQYVEEQNLARLEQELPELVVLTKR